MLRTYKVKLIKEAVITFDYDYDKYVKEGGRYQNNIKEGHDEHIRSQAMYIERFLNMETSINVYNAEYEVNNANSAAEIISSSDYDPYRQLPKAWGMATERGNEIISKLAKKLIRKLRHIDWHNYIDTVLTIRQFIVSCKELLNRKGYEEADPGRMQTEISTWLLSICNEDTVNSILETGESKFVKIKSWLPKRLPNAYEPVSRT